MEDVLAITDKAQQKVLGFREGVADSERQAMWVEVTGVQNGEWTYNISLKPLAGAGDDDSLPYADDLGIVVPAADIEKLRGATVDWSDDLMAGGLLVVNPNKPDPASPAIGGRPAADLSGPVPQRVMQVLAEQINPAIAAHGGSAELGAVGEDTAYARLGGGRARRGAGRRVRRVRDGIGDARTGHRGGDPPGGAGGAAGGRRDRPRERHEPVLRG